MPKRVLITLLFLLFIKLLSFSQSSHTIHVMVALCDNKYQGIVKVPKAIGNGQDPDNNLYWGCAYGVRTYFKKQHDWKEIKRYRPNKVCLERIVFKHKSKAYYLVADGYDGAYIKQCTTDFLNSCSGQSKDSLLVENKMIGIHGNSKMLAYIGHNGLMDFKLNDTFLNKDNKTRDVIILACASKPYFSPYIKSAKATPIIWSTHLMSPEAYTLYGAITAYINNEKSDIIRNNAASAYAKYQKCSLKAAKRLIVTGW